MHIYWLNFGIMYVYVCVFCILSYMMNPVISEHTVYAKTNHILAKTYKTHHVRFVSDDNT